jgi:hypothetical protein
MTIALNGFDLLASIGANQQAFAQVEADVDKAALSILQKRLKAKGLTVAHLREVAAAIGSDNLRLIVDHLPDKDIGALVRKLDKFWPGQDHATIADRRRHAAALATGNVEATAKKAPAERSKGAKPKATWTASMGTRPPRAG